MTEPFPNLLRNLRSVAEPTRLRALAILSRGQFSVTELTQILGQSQPRVSRHLKLLGDCGLLEHFREQHWIYYRVPADTAGGRFARELLAMLDPDDAVVQADHGRVTALLEERAASAPAVATGSARDPSGDNEIAHALADELGEQGLDALLYVGRSPSGIVGVNGSRLEVQRARALLHSRGFSHCVLQQGDLRTLPLAAGGFDVVVLDRALAEESRPLDALRAAVRALKSPGRLLGSRTTKRSNGAAAAATRLRCCASGSRRAVWSARGCVRSTWVACTCCWPWQRRSGRPWLPEAVAGPLREAGSDATGSRVIRVLPA
jgi:DNA-binding transcriptional ArsR family regulator